MKRTCSVPDCNSPHMARGWCRKHYQRWRSNGTTATPSLSLPAEERFWAKVDRSGGDDACWAWTGSITGGYGGCWVKEDHAVRPAHRVAYQLMVGPIPDGMVIDHTCHNADANCNGGDECPHRRCCNPAHLEPVVNRENIRRSTVSSASRNAAKDTCKNGHGFTPENIYWRADNREWRACRECVRQAQARYYQRKKRALKEA